MRAGKNRPRQQQYSLRNKKKTEFGNVERGQQHIENMINTSLKYLGTDKINGVWNMKKFISITMTVFLLAALAACGSNSQAGTNETTAAAEGQKKPVETANMTEAQNTTEAETTSANSSAVSEAPSQTVSHDTDPATGNIPAHSDVLVAFFSATGTTKRLAERIAAVTGGDLYEILAADPYTAEDLNYSDRSSRSTSEQNDKNARPAIGSEDISLEGYTTIYLGFPIWWGEEPRILDTFVEKYNFEGITVIPFCTSGGSGIGRSGPNMEALAESGTWLEGKRLSASVSEADLQSWINGLK